MVTMIHDVGRRGSIDTGHSGNGRFRQNARGIRVDRCERSAMGQSRSVIVAVDRRRGHMGTMAAVVSLNTAAGMTGWHGCRIGNLVAVGGGGGVVVVTALLSLGCIQEVGASPGWREDFSRVCLE